MPKRQETTSRDIDFAIREIYKLLCDIQYEECQGVLEQAFESRARDNDLDVDISESEEEESEDETNYSSCESEDDS